MPYKREGKTVYVLRRGRWEVIKKHVSAFAAKRHLAALNIHAHRPGRKNVANRSGAKKKKKKKWMQKAAKRMKKKGGLARLMQGMKGGMPPGMPH